MPLPTRLWFLPTRKIPTRKNQKSYFLPTLVEADNEVKKYDKI